MTISNENVKQIFNGNGVTLSFPFSIVYFVAGELKVYLRDETTFVETLLTLTTHYTVTPGVNDGYRINGGTLLMVTAPTSNQQVIVKRSLNLRQDDFDPAPTAAYQPEQVEVTFDRLVAMVQQLNELIDRAIKTSLGSGITSLELPVGANKFIKWNSAGTALELETIDLTTLQNDIIANTNNIAALGVTVAALSGAIAGLQSQIDDNTADIATNAGNIGNTNAALSATDANVLAAQNDILSIKNRLNELEGFLGLTGEQIIANNTADQALTDMSFSGSLLSAIIIDFTIARKTDTDSKYTSGILYLVFSETTNTWRIEKGLEVLDYAGVTFAVTTLAQLGQVKATSNNLSGTSYSGKIKYNIRKFEV
jgi:hypothetical protein